MKRRFSNFILMLLSGGLASALLVGACFAQTAGSGASEGLTETVHRVRLARGAELAALVSRRADTTATTAVLLFAGSPGILRLREENGVIVNDMGGNFLIRARRHLNTPQVFTVAVDCPSDQHHACDDRYRTSSEHVADVAALISSLKNHQDDPCVATRYASVAARRGQVPLITVLGSAEPRGDPCQARSQHGFVGRERVVMQALHDWVTERKAPQSVGEPGN